MKIVFFGSSKHVLPTIQALKTSFDLVLVVSTEQDPSEAIPYFCKTENIPLLSIQRFNDENLRTIESVKSDIAALGYFGLMIPEQLLNHFQKGIINLHPSLLPKYRGPTPIQESILNGDHITGISIIRLDEKMDHGPLLFQKEDQLKENDTADSLYSRLFKMGAYSLPEILDQYINGKLTPAPQDDSKATFTKLLSKNDGSIDITNPPSKDILNRMIRAYFPWPGVFFKSDINGTDKIIKLLPGEKVQVEGKKPMSFKDFLNGYKEGEEILSKLDLF